MTEIQEAAYSKILSHLCKYPQNPCVGILLGKTAESDQKQNSTASAPLIVDALPLFHSLPIGPLVELSLTQGELIASKKGLKVVGVYAAPHLNHERHPSNLITKFASKLEESRSTSSVILLWVNNTQIVNNDDGTFYSIFSSDHKFEKPLPGLYIPSSETRSNAKKTIQSNQYESLVDFEAHCEDPSKAWF